MDATRGPLNVAIVGPGSGKPIKQRPHTDKHHACERCGCRRARDADISDELCTPCRATAPSCRVCSGRGTLGRDGTERCYRCKGSGKQPIPDHRLRRHR